MINFENRLFCRLDGLTAPVREQQRLEVLTEMGLLGSDSIPVFEEATQTAAHFLAMPIAVLGLMEQNCQRYKSAIGLSRLGLMNELAIGRQLPRLESFCSYVVDSQQPLVIADTLTHPAFTNSLLVHQYGVRAYLGVPLMTAAGCCLGTLAVMSLTPHQFTDKDVEFLSLTARWSMSEFERQSVATRQTPVAIALPNLPTAANATPGLNPAIANQLKVDLLSQLTQELRTPLTSVLGMASVLNREIYGPLTAKQKEYLDIIHRSGQYLLSLVNEIVELSELKDGSQDMSLTSVDIEMLCQQVSNTLSQAVHRREQQIRLSVEPGRRVWLLDKSKVHQMLYHLVFCVIQSAAAGSVIRLHVSRKDDNLNLTVWVFHPWLGESLAQVDHPLQPALVSVAAGLAEYEFAGEMASSESPAIFDADYPDSQSAEFAASSVEDSIDSAHPANLGLLLCQQLAELHGGQLTIQPRSTAGYRYVITLPRLQES
jgi:signal transduction histidine kinase